jgi:hypothetical protein
VKVEELIEQLKEYENQDYVVCLPEIKDIGLIEVDEEAHVIHLYAESIIEGANCVSCGNPAVRATEEGDMCQECFDSLPGEDEPRFSLDPDSICYGCQYYTKDEDEEGDNCTTPEPCIQGNMNGYRMDG